MSYFVLNLIFGLVLLTPLSASAQSTDPSDSTPYYKEVWEGYSEGVRFYMDSPEETCRATNEIGIDAAFYKGVRFQRFEEFTGSNATRGACIGRTFSTVVPIIEVTAYIHRTCFVYTNTPTGPVLDSTKTKAGKCPTEQTCELKVDNPVELPSMVKVENSRDWTSALDPRFMIERHYRSDDSFFSRNWNGARRQADGFASVWMMRYNDTLDDADQGNPFDPLDTRRVFPVRKANGDLTYFVSLDTDGVSYPAISKQHQSTLIRSNVIIGGRFNYRFVLDDGAGVLQSFDRNTTNLDLTYLTSSIVWPDGYKITFERTGMQLTRMFDNKGQSASFVYSASVLPGATWPYISEIIFSFTAPGTTIAVETGRLQYQYTTIAPRGPDSPVISSVNYVAAGATAPTPIFRYTYTTSASATRPVWPPLLTGISDGSTSAAGALQYYATYTYGNYNHAVGSQFVSYGVTSSTQAGGTDQKTYANTGNGRIAVTNGRGLTTTYDFGFVENDTRLMSSAGAQTPNCLPTNAALTYGSDRLYTAMVERNGATTQLTRNTRGLITRRIEDAFGPNPRTTDYEWDATRHLMTALQTAELRTEYTYDAAGLMTRMAMIDRISSSPTFGQRREWNMTYTTLASGLKVLTRVDGPGLTTNNVNDITNYTYTTLGQLDTVTDANGLVTRILARNAKGLPTQVEMPDLTVWTFAYDGQDRLITSGVRGIGQTTTLTNTYAYNLWDQVTSVTNTRGKVWTFTYDAAHRMTGSTSPTGDKMTYTLDTLGNITRVAYSNGTGPTTFFEDSTFDELGRVLTTVGAMGQTWRFSHDREDNLATTRDPLSNLTTNAYDGLNRLISTVDRGGFTTGMEYNVADQMTEYTDPRLIETDFVYNGFGEVIREVSADRGTITYTYDTRGLATSRTDGRGITVSYAYDNGGRLTLIDYPAGGIGDRAFTYDQAFITTPANANKGHVGRISDGTIRTDFSHQTLSSGPQVTATALYPLNRTYTVIERFDFEGNPLSTVYPSGIALLYDIDNANRITRIRLQTTAGVRTSLVSSIGYRPNGPITGMTFGDGYNQARTYDSSYRLTGLRDFSGTTTLRNWTYGYDARDNLTAITDLQLAANNEVFTYTPREHLAGATGPYGTLTYTYDGVGNRITSRLGSATDTYTYPPAANRLTGINLATGGTRAYTYDGAGNVLTDSRGAGYAYTYDSAGRMASMSINGVLQGSYRYDFAGRQAIRVIAATGVTIHSVFDSQGRRIAEYNEATGALIREYVWLGWEPVAVIEGGVVSYIRTDHIGRPVFATNSTTGVKTWTASYDPFGGVRTTTGSPISARFPGQWFQAESGLHQNWMRDYDPTTGRYLQADPLGLVDGASVYGYALGSPMVYTDPTGEIVPLLAGAARAAAMNALLGVAAGYLADRYWGDGCYTLGEAGRDALYGVAGGAAIGAAFKGAGAAVKAFTGGAGAATAQAITKAISGHGHHPIAKFLGGSANQVLTRLPQALHTGKGGFHSQLNAALRSRFGMVGGGVGGSRNAWATYFAANPGSQREALDILLDVSRNFDVVNGTSVTQGVWTNIMNGAFKVFP
jgi:RHS repeat-associated protein